MEKLLVVHPERCTGCRMCEVACSFTKEREFNPFKSRIRIMKWEAEGIDFPIVCQQCEDAPCMFVCPTAALYRDKTTKAVLINPDLCIGCRACTVVCPFGAIDFDGEKMIKCDLCSGDPTCVKYCQIKAIEYLHPRQASIRKGREAARKLQTGLTRVIITE